MTYWCNDGYRPSGSMTSICNVTGLWTPVPEQHNCTEVEGEIYLYNQVSYRYTFLSCSATVSITKGVLESDIECPGGILSFNCSIKSNSENVHLVWRVTILGDEPITITYNETSALQDVDTVNTFIDTSLESYTSEEYIQSLLFYTVLATDPAILVATLECSITEIASVSIDIISSAGMLVL